MNDVIFDNSWTLLNAVLDPWKSGDLTSEKADFKAIRVALLKCTPYNLPVEIEENVVKLFEKKEASSHALATRDGVALASTSAHLIESTFEAWMKA